MNVLETTICEQSLFDIITSIQKDFESISYRRFLILSGGYVFSATGKGGRLLIDFSHYCPIERICSSIGFFHASVISSVEVETIDKDKVKLHLESGAVVIVEHNGRFFPCDDFEIFIDTVQSISQDYGVKETVCSHFIYRARKYKEIQYVEQYLLDKVIKHRIETLGYIIENKYRWKTILIKGKSNLGHIVDAEHPMHQQFQEMSQRWELLLQKDNIKFSGIRDLLNNEKELLHSLIP
ncbi:hypothetical protein E0485_11890 [Paenibacillus albiflavus]|uniref:Uncharacterized protein n=1 Tax=Paenibacillus albiflavus TaxID=2545760 RepID=A0A4R4EG88_9BACL|nr:hypothetical protein [Paenibacillus albiflavus]TCZ77155.1 hypothetical protein E0485_11890 [Paenibacillus albiflavus]